MLGPTESKNRSTDSSLNLSDAIIPHSETNISRALDAPRSGAARDHGSSDVAFSVPFVHRLRTTEQIAGKDFQVLVDVLRADGLDHAKVLLVAERPVAESTDQVSRLATRLGATLEINLVRDVVLVAGGEEVKNDSRCVEEILSQINTHDLDRRSYVIAIGGGAMLDAVGYATAIAHRGVRLIRLPTTTLAQGDSGVGVKNAINYFGKKNWVGTFSVPWAVINDASLLESLSDRDFYAGFSESVKVALLKSRNEFDWLCRNAESIRRRDMENATRAIATSCNLHLRHITEGGDPFEMLEARPLDFGHWSAHKLEPITNFQIRHGEAVGIGVAIDCFYSHLKLGFPLSDAMSVCQCLFELGLPLWHEALTPLDRLLDGLEEFRQHLGGRLTITMLKEVGKSVDVHEIDSAAMARAIGMLRDKSELLKVGGKDRSA